MTKFSEHTARLFDVLRDICVDVVRRFESQDTQGARPEAAAPQRAAQDDEPVELKAHVIEGLAMQEVFEVAPKPEDGVRYYCGMRSFCLHGEIEIVSITDRNGIELLLGAGSIDACYFNTHGQRPGCEFDFGPADPRHPITIKVRSLLPEGTGPAVVKFVLFSRAVPMRLAAA